jgi:hypothetical protein
MAYECKHGLILYGTCMECEKERVSNLRNSPYYTRGQRAGKISEGKRLENPYLASAGEAWQLGFDEASRDKTPAKTQSYYKFCVVCGQEEGFPEYEGHDPTDHTCFVCK